LDLSLVRERCIKCFHKNCYCQHIQSFDPKIRFVILIQYREAQKHIATGRLSHLCLQNSELIKGYDYTLDARVNEILANPRYFPVVLHPGAKAANFSRITAKERVALFPADREPVIFVVDGTWISARKIMQKSANLQNIPQICFDPPHPSRFRLRKQPKDFCFSTVEAIHHTIELLGENFQFNTAGRAHDHLLEMFSLMEEQQIRLIRNQPRFLRHLAPS
jgi:DTW domain-containing protein YfiP